VPITTDVVSSNLDQIEVYNKQPQEQAKQPAEQDKQPAEQAKQPTEQAKQPAEQAKKHTEQASIVSVLNVHEKWLFAILKSQ
jgi:membrane protein involved in colicin uptake